MHILNIREAWLLFFFFKVKNKYISCIFFFLIPVDPDGHLLGYSHSTQDHSSKILQSFAKSAPKHISPFPNV